MCRACVGLRGNERSALGRIDGSGIELESIGRIAEDTTCWESYIDRGTQLKNGTMASEAKAFFEMRPPE